MDDKEIKVDSVSIDTPTAENDAPAADTNPIDELNQKIDELNDKYMRAVAELENTRRRATLDIDAAARNRAMSVARQFLPVVDAIVAAATHSPDDAGVMSMMRAMDAALAQIGIVKIESVGQILNPQFHNAIQVTDAPADADPKPAPNTIIAEMQSGYMFGDSVLRPAMVIVCK